MPACELAHPPEPVIVVAPVLPRERHVAAADLYSRLCVDVAMLPGLFADDRCATGTPGESLGEGLITVVPSSCDETSAPDTAEQLALHGHGQRLQRVR